MASARNVEGNSRLVEFDGTGGLYTKGAVDLARMTGNNHWFGVGLPSSCSAGNTWPGYWDVYLQANKTVRIVLVWTQYPFFSDYANRPSIDYDLQVNSPSGASLFYSDSWDNNYEIVEFVAPASGTYRVYANRHSCGYVDTQMGIALAVYERP